MSRKQEIEENEGGEYWIAYSDLLVSLLMVFVLLLFLALSRVQTEIAAAQETTKAINSAISAGQQHLQGAVRIDTTKGAIVMDSEVLFEYNSSVLQPEAASVIRQVATQYIPEVLGQPAVDSMLQEIVIEGHTDTVGTYMFNLRLSQERAYSVLREMVEGTFGAPYAERLRILIVASGKSEVHPVLKLDGSVDPLRSRRIEIHFRTRTDAMLKRVLEQAGQSAGADS